MFFFVVILIISYFIGSINSAILTCKILGLSSPRDIGSGNPGTTNVYRLGGKIAAFITLIGDITKGLIQL